MVRGRIHSRGRLHPKRTGPFGDPGVYYYDRNSLRTATISQGHPVLITILVEPKLWAEQIPRPYDRAEENARSLYGHFGMTGG